MTEKIYIFIYIYMVGLIYVCVCVCIFIYKYIYLFAPLWQPINLKCHWGWNLGPSANGGFINRGGQFLTSG